MPTEPPDPGVPQSFLDAVHSCRWRDGHLVRPNGTSTYPVPVEGKWSLATFGRLLAEPTFTLLWGGIAESDGSFMSGKVRYRLREESGNAVAVKV